MQLKNDGKPVELVFTVDEIELLVNVLDVARQVYEMQVAKIPDDQSILDDVAGMYNEFRSLYNVLQ